MRSLFLNLVLLTVAVQSVWWKDGKSNKVDFWGLEKGSFQPRVTLRHPAPRPMSLRAVCNEPPAMRCKTKMVCKEPCLGHILVTGGTGFIGSHTVTELLNQGYKVSQKGGFEFGERTGFRLYL
eukprot:1331178-Amorphochlora_amoeboformis.AAC.1